MTLNVGVGVGVPPYEVHEFVPRRSRYCTSVFVLNEGSRFTAQLESMRSLASSIDIIVADGGSTDGGTDPDRLRSMGIRALLVNRGAGGLGVQMRMAFHYALSQGYEGVIAVDGNGKDDTSAIPLFASALDRGFDHVQGSRFVPGGRAVNTPRDRLLALRLIHAPMIRLAAGFPYTDTTNGFRGYSRRLIGDPRIAPLRDCFRGYELHYYLAIRAPRLGFRAIEVPVTRAYPIGAPPTKIHGLRGRGRVLSALIRACLGTFNPEAGA